MKANTLQEGTQQQDFSNEHHEGPNTGQVCLHIQDCFMVGEGRVHSNVTEDDTQKAVFQN